METKVYMNAKSHWGMATRGCSQRRRAGQCHGCESVPEPSCQGKSLLAQSLPPWPELKQGHPQPPEWKLLFLRTHRSQGRTETLHAHRPFQTITLPKPLHPGSCLLRPLLLHFRRPWAALLSPLPEADDLLHLPGQQTWTSPPAQPSHLRPSSPTTERTFPQTATLPYLG